MVISLRAKPDITGILFLRFNLTDIYRSSLSISLKNTSVMTGKVNENNNIQNVSRVISLLPAPVIGNYFLPPVNGLSSSIISRSFGEFVFVKKR